MTREPYILAGVELPSVTEVLDTIAKPSLLYWANQQGRLGIPIDAARDEAFSVGSRVHALIEMVARGQAADLDVFEERGQIGHAFRAWQRWASTREIEPVAIEERMISRRQVVGGTVDFVGVEGEDRVLFDWKTTSKPKAPYSEYWIQTTAYASIWAELHPAQPITHISIVMIEKTADGQAVEYRRPVNAAWSSHAWQAWCSALSLFHAMRNLGKAK